MGGGPEVVCVESCIDKDSKDKTYCKIATTKIMCVLSKVSFCVMFQTYWNNFVCVQFLLPEYT